MLDGRWIVPVERAASHTVTCARACVYVCVYPAGTWSFPALCTHSHAWPLVSFPFLAGLRFTPSGLDVVPALPLSLGAYAYRSPLASIAFDGDRRFTGHYAPSGDGAVANVRFDLSSMARRWHVEVAHGDASARRLEFAVTLVE